MNLTSCRVVLDTNVLVSLLVFRDSRFDPLRAAWIKGEIEVISDAPIRRELERVLHYPEFIARQSPARILEFYDAHIVPGEATTAALPLCRDPDDQMFIRLAAGAAAEVLVSDDRQLLRMRRRVIFEIETPLVFQRRFSAI
jgi:putative PIN family toxin of toxin-antitoxin system